MWAKQNFWLFVAFPVFVKGFGVLVSPTVGVVGLGLSLLSLRSSDGTGTPQNTS